MKNMKRAYRRYKKFVKTKKRAEDNYYWLGWDNNSKAEFINEVMTEGRSAWLQTTGTPCSCWMCQYGKYERLTSEEVRKIIDEQIE